MLDARDIEERVIRNLATWGKLLQKGRPVWSRIDRNRLKQKMALFDHERKMDNLIWAN